MPQIKHRSSVKSIEGSAVEVTFTIPATEVGEEYDLVCKEFQKEVFVKGFRKGKVPRQVVVTKFRDLLKDQTTQSLIEKSFSNFSKEEAEVPKPISQPQLLGSPELASDKDFEFTVSYDVFPTLKLPGPDLLRVTEHTVSVSEEDIAAELEKYRSQNAIVEEKQGDTVEEGDLITVDFEALEKDGAAIDGSKRQDFVFKAGVDENPFSLKEELVGLKKGERNIVDHPQDDATQVAVTVTRIRSYDLPDIDDELAKDIDEKYQNLDDLKKDIQLQLDESTKGLQREQYIKELLEMLRAETDFSVPQVMIDESFQLQFRQFLSRFPDTVSAEQLGKMGLSPDVLKERWLPDIEKSVREQVIVRTFIEERDITVGEEEAEAYIKEHAGSEDPDELVEQYRKQHLLGRVQQELAEKALFDALIKEAKKEKGSTYSHKEFVEFVRVSSQEQEVKE